MTLLLTRGIEVEVVASTEGEVKLSVRAPGGDADYGGTGAASGGAYMSFLSGRARLENQRAAALAVISISRLVRASLNALHRTRGWSAPVQGLFPHWQARARTAGRLSPEHQFLHC